MRWLFKIFLIAVSVLIFVLVTMPIYDEAKIIKVEADKYNEALANARILQEERDRLTQKFNSFNQDDLRRLEKIAPDSVENIKLILEIQEVAQNRGILVRNVRFRPDQFIEQDPDAPTTTQTQSANLRRPGAATNLDYEIYDFEFSIEGKYGAFIEFMKLLEKSLRIIDIKTIAFAPGASEDRDGVYVDNYSYTFRINTFRLKDL
jgi:hypothetical protein